MSIGGVAQLVRANGSYPLGRWFKSTRRYQIPFCPAWTCRCPTPLHDFTTSVRKSTSFGLSSKRLTCHDSHSDMFDPVRILHFRVNCAVMFRPRTIASHPYSIAIGSDFCQHPICILYAH